MRADTRQEESSEWALGIMIRSFKNPFLGVDFAAYFILITGLSIMLYLLYGIPQELIPFTARFIEIELT